jgi:hypothetical protein
MFPYVGDKTSNYTYVSSIAVIFPVANVNDESLVSVLMDDGRASSTGLMFKMLRSIRKCISNVGSLFLCINI